MITLKHGITVDFGYEETRQVWVFLPATLSDAEKNKFFWIDTKDEREELLKFISTTIKDLDNQNHEYESNTNLVIEMLKIYQ